MAGVQAYLGFSFSTIFKLNVPYAWPFYEIQVLFVAWLSLDLIIVTGLYICFDIETEMIWWKS